MAQKLIQTQEQKLAQLQRLSQQQMLVVHLLEMPITELEENVNAQLDDNPALEKVDEGEDDMPDLRDDGSVATDEPEGFEEENEREERQEALDDALENIGYDDQMPDTQWSQRQNADYEEIVYGDTISFYDKLKEQMGELELTAQQEHIMEYIIGSLDDDGLLRKDLDTICDELAIYQNIDVSVTTIEEVLRKLQTFDPAGIGARSLQECLLLQIDRLLDEERENGQSGRLTHLMREVITNCFEDFTRKRWSRIQEQLRLTDATIEALKEEIKRLNPKPGAAMGETIGRSLQQITPDFIVDTADDGTVTFSMNNGGLPNLAVSSSFTKLVNDYKKRKEKLNRQDREAMVYARDKVDKARNFIDAIQQRRHTMYVTMKAIIAWQHRFFTDGDEADLKPMILKDIAEKTGLDISTISRVSNVKYVQTRWGTFPLRFFFTDGYDTGSGEETSTRKIKLALKEMIGKEDTSRPLSDEALAKEMKKLGYPVARRTVAKYREQMGIPIARLRKD